MTRPEAHAFAIWGPIRPEDLPGLCARVCGVLDRHRGETLECDVTGVGASATAVDALARLQLAARGHGCTVRFRHASDELAGLVTFLGLDAVLLG